MVATTPVVVIVVGAFVVADKVVVEAVAGVEDVVLVVAAAVVVGAVLATAVVVVVADVSPGEVTPFEEPAHAANPMISADMYATTMILTLSKHTGKDNGLLR